MQHEKYKIIWVSKLAAEQGIAGGQLDGPEGLHWSEVHLAMQDFSAELISQCGSEGPDDILEGRLRVFRGDELFETHRVVA